VHYLDLCIKSIAPIKCTVLNTYEHYRHGSDNAKNCNFPLPTATTNILLCVNNIYYTRNVLIIPEPQKIYFKHNLPIRLKKTVQILPL